jgi:hypothetical protein
MAIQRLDREDVAAFEGNQLSLTSSEVVSISEMGRCRMKSTIVVFASSLMQKTHF